MVVRRAAVVAVCLVMSVTMAPSTSADPDAEPAAAAAAPADGRVPSADPVTFNTPDGWALAAMDTKTGVHSNVCSSVCQ